jgi:cardiolipin synthase (CMP-forming)
MKDNEKKKLDLSLFSPKKNLSIPNLLSLIRVLMIPLIIWLYLTERTWLAVIMLGVSALTDAVDGYIARHFNQITPLGKVLDPIADKLTQFCLGICLVSRFPVVIPVVVVLVIKELMMLSWGLSLLRAGQKPFSARWWGKLSTTSFYAGVIIVMIFSVQLGTTGRDLVFFAITMLMLYSMLRYWHLFRQKIKDAASV